MATRLPPTARKTLKERRERVRLALEDVRRFARARGAIFLLPRVGVETAAAASGEWDLRAIPSQREVVRGALRGDSRSCRVACVAAVTWSFGDCLPDKAPL